MPPYRNWLPEGLELGWNQLIERHESLRTVFHEEEGHPVQQIQPYIFRPLPQMDLTKLSLEERERKLEQWIQTEVESPFDLEQGPLFRGKLIKFQKKNGFFCVICIILSQMDGRWKSYFKNGWHFMRMRLVKTSRAGTTTSSICRFCSVAKRMVER